MDLRHLQAFLGHANLNTVAVYTQVGIKTLKDLHQAMHPATGLPPRAGERKGEAVRDLLESREDEVADEEAG